MQSSVRAHSARDGGTGVEGNLSRTVQWSSDRSPGHRARTPHPPSRPDSFAGRLSGRRGDNRHHSNDRSRTQTDHDWRLPVFCFALPFLFCFSPNPPPITVIKSWFKKSVHATVIPSWALVQQVSTRHANSFAASVQSFNIANPHPADPRRTCRPRGRRVPLEAPTSGNTGKKQVSRYVSSAAGYPGKPASKAPLGS